MKLTWCMVRGHLWQHTGDSYGAYEKRGCYRCGLVQQRNFLMKSRSREDFRWRDVEDFQEP